MPPCGSRMTPLCQSVRLKQGCLRGQDPTLPSPEGDAAPFVVLPACRQVKAAAATAGSTAEGSSRDWVSWTP